MITTLTAYTSEVDDIELAVEQIKSQLSFVGGLKKNTIAIVACHYEFVLSGVYEAICDALPFDVVGTISSAQSVAEEIGTLLMTLTVMTSDEVEFTKILTPSLLEAPEKSISESYKAASGDRTPALILAFAPYIMQNCGDDYVNILTDVSGGLPCFGTLAVDDTMDFSNSYMLMGGQHYRDKMGMVLIFGDIRPKFFVANISESRLLDRTGIITKSEGPVLMEVNGRPVIEYLSDLGLVEATEEQYAMTSIPFLLDYNDGMPKVSKMFVMLTPERHAICAGAMPEGSTLHMAMTDRNDVILTTSIAVDAILKEIESASVLLSYTCIGRAMTLGADQFKELELIKERIGGKLPFMIANSGGEMCPTQSVDGKIRNRFHNNAFIACVI